MTEEEEEEEEEEQPLRFCGSMRLLCHQLLFILTCASPQDSQQ